MDDLFGRESLNRVAKYLLIGVTILLLFFFLLAFLRIGLVYWLWSTVETWVTVRLGLDYYASQLLTMIVVSTVVAVLPTLAWYLLLGRKKWQGTAAMIGGQALIFILVYTIGSGVCFNRQTGEALCWYVDTPDGRYFSATPGFHPTYGIELKQYTKDIALSGKQSTVASTAPSNVSSATAPPKVAAPKNGFQKSNASEYFPSSMKSAGSYEISVPGDGQWYDTGISVKPTIQLQMGFLRGTQGNVQIEVGDVRDDFSRPQSPGAYYEYDFVTRSPKHQFERTLRNSGNLRLRSTQNDVVIHVDVRTGYNN